MDDLLTGFDNIEKGVIINILDTVQFKLRKWMSIHPRLLEKIDPIDQEVINSVRTLGLCWKPKTDKLSFVVKPFEAAITNTKRNILSAISKCID
jgi:hypothetical protein